MKYVIAVKKKLIGLLFKKRKKLYFRNPVHSQEYKLILVLVNLCVFLFILGTLTSNSLSEVLRNIHKSSPSFPFIQIKIAEN